MRGSMALWGSPHRRTVIFRLSDSAENLEKVIRGRCSDVPPEIIAIVRSFKPYKDGDFALWALNKLANTKHTYLMPIGDGGGGTFIKNLRVTSSGRCDIGPPRWNRAKNEIVVLELGAVFFADFLEKVDASLVGGEEMNCVDLLQGWNAARASACRPWVSSLRAHGSEIITGARPRCAPG